MPYTVLIHGSPGSGKDTQVDLIKGEYGCEKIGTGEMFRSLIKEKHVKALEAREYMDKGEMVPSDLTYKLLEDWIRGYDGEKTWFLVSIVRSVDQIPLLDELLEKQGRTLDLFLYFQLPDEKVIERVKSRKSCPICGTIYHSRYKREKNEGACDKDGARLTIRTDDQGEVITRRITENNRLLAPVLEKYAKRGILVEVDASPSIAEVNKNVLRVLKDFSVFPLL